MKLPCTTGPVVTPILPPQSTCQPATNQVGRCGTVELFTINFYSILNFFSFSIFIQIFSSSTSANLICYQLIFLAELLFPCYIYLYHFYVKYRIYDAEKSLFLIFSLTLRFHDVKHEELRKLDCLLWWYFCTELRGTKLSVVL